MTVRSAFKQSKKLKMARKVVKNPDEKEFGKGIKDMMTGFDNMKANAHVSINDIVRDMARAGAGVEPTGEVSSCFDGARISDVAAMLQDSEPEEEKEEDEADEDEDPNLAKDEGDDDDNASTTAHATSSTSKWFDHENAVNVAKRKWRSAVTTQKTACEKLQTDARKAIDDAAAAPTSSEVADAKAVCERRLAFAVAMLAGDSHSKLSEMIQVFVLSVSCYVVLFFSV